MAVDYIDKTNKIVFIYPIYNRFLCKEFLCCKKKKKEQQQGNMLEKKLNKNDNYLQTKGYGIVYIRKLNKGNIREDIDWINIY